MYWTRVAATKNGGSLGILMPSRHERGIMVVPRPSSSILLLFREGFHLAASQVPGFGAADYRSLERVSRSFAWCRAKAEEGTRWMREQAEELTQAQIVSRQISHGLAPTLLFHRDV